MQRVARFALALLAAASATGCADRLEPVAPSVRTVSPSALYDPGVVASSSEVALLMMEVRSGRTETLLRYDVVLEKGVRQEPLTLPVGTGYELSIRAFDREGRETHAGVTVVEYVKEGDGTSFEVSLESLESRVAKEALHLRVGVRGAPRVEKGAKIVIEYEPAEVTAGEPIRLRAVVLDANGERIELDPRLLDWFVDDPRVGFLDPARPPKDPNVAVSIKWDWIKEYLKVGVTYAQVTTVVWIQLLTLSDPYVEVAAGGTQTCALRQSGVLDCWGSNNHGALGMGAIATTPYQCGSSHPGAAVDIRCVPSPVAGGKKFSAVSVGNDNVCAIEQVTNAAYCWGSNYAGQLGVSNGGADVLQPTSPVSGSLAFRSLSVGTHHACGVTTSEDVYCWGSNSGGKLGTTGAGGPTPVKLPNKYSSVNASAATTCALTKYAQLECYGPSIGSPPLTTFTSLGGGTAYHQCAIGYGETIYNARVNGPFAANMNVNGRLVWCWGWNDEGQLGDGTTYYGTRPATRVMFGGAPFEADFVAMGWWHTCALNAGSAYCWGDDFYAQLGSGVLGSDSSVPKKISNQSTIGTFTKLAVGDKFACGLRSDGAIYCWGSNWGGQLGIGAFDQTNPGVPTPTRVIGS
jgi:alpha-tubulin suppressor-like RCC1 family protein